jgi:hypothetical protein
MSMPYTETMQFAYLTGCAILGGLFWLPIFVLRPQLRKELLLMSAFSAPLGIVTTYFYLADYWHPIFAFQHFFALEDFIFAFFIGGFAGTIYEAVFGKKLGRPYTPYKRYWAMGVFPFGVLWLYVGALLGFISIYSSIVLLMLLGCILIYLRPDLRASAFFSAIMTAIALFITYQVWFLFYPTLIAEWWVVHNLYGVFIFKVPIEEMLWAGAWGFFAGPVFEFVAGSRYIQR